jgi:hypothetical protein
MSCLSTKEEMLSFELLTEVALAFVAVLFGG